MDIHHWNLDRKAFEFAFLSSADFTPVRERHVEAGASHVDGDAVGFARLLGDGDSADDTRRRPRQDRVDGTLDGRFHAHRSAVGLHDVHIRLEAHFGDALFEPTQVALHDGCDIGVDCSRAHPLVLFELRQYLVRERDRDVRQLTTDSVADGLFVHRVGVGVDETHGNSVDVGVLDSLDDIVEPLYLHRRQHLSGVEHSLLGLETQAARDQRIGAANAPVVEVGPVLPADLQDVAEPRGNDQRRLRALTLKERVRRYRRAMYEEIDPVRGNGVPVHQFADSGSYSEGLVDRRGRRLGEFETVGIGVVEGEVGERSPDIDAQPIAHGIMFLTGSEYAVTARSQAT